MYPTKQSLKPILKSPDDDAPRQKLAQTLIAKGDPFGDFLSLQLQTRRIIWDTKGKKIGTLPGSKALASNPEADARIGALYKRHQSEWFGHIRQLCRVLGIARGFPEYCETSAESFLTNANTILNIAPLRYLTLTTIKPPHIPPLAAAPWWAKLHTINLACQHLNAKNLAELLTNSSFLNIQGLSVAMNDLGPDGANHLTQAPFSALKQFSAHNTGAPLTEVAAWIRAPWFKHLQIAHLKDNPAPTYIPTTPPDTDAERDAIFDALCALPPGLTELSLPCRADDANLKRLRQAPLMQTLQSLEVRSTRLVTPQGRAAFTRPNGQELFVNGVYN